MKYLTDEDFNMLFIGITALFLLLVGLKLLRLI